MTEGHWERVERFCALYDAAYPRVMAYCLRRARTREDADDVVAEVMLAAWRRLDEIPAGPARLPWVLGVARRALANHYRSVDRRRRLAERAAAQPATFPAEHDLVHEALARLRPDQQEMLTLSAWDDLDNDEIAAVLGITPALAAVRLHRARRRLARELGRRGMTGLEGDSPQSAGPTRTPERVQGTPPAPEEKERP
jgi:RNA polymerase sigma-70 factor (ECF subfamily)